jgi:hypothetical protein
VNDTDFPYSRRKHSRNSVLFKAKILFENQSIDCEILDISAGGARVQSKGQLEHGLSVILNLDPFGEIPCEIACSGNRFGHGSLQIAYNKFVLYSV